MPDDPIYAVGLSPESIEKLKNHEKELTPEEKAKLEEEAAKWEGMAAEVPPFQGDAKATDEAQPDLAETMPLGVPGADEALAAGVILDAALPDTPADAPRPPLVPQSAPERQRTPSTVTETVAAELNSQNNISTENVVQGVGGMMGTDVIKQDAATNETNLSLAQQAVDGMADRVNAGQSSGETETNNMINTAMVESANMKVRAEEAVRDAYSKDADAERSAAEAEEAIEKVRSAKESLDTAASTATASGNASKASEDLQSELQQAADLLHDAETIREANAEAEAEEEAEKAKEAQDLTNPDETTEDEEPEEKTASGADLDALEEAQSTDVHELAAKAQERANKAATDEMLTKLNNNAA